jgi:hypothetical protein
METFSAQCWTGSYDFFNHDGLAELNGPTRLCTSHTSGHPQAPPPLTDDGMKKNEGLKFREPENRRRKLKTNTGTVKKWKIFERKKIFKKWQQLKSVFLSQ